MLARGTFRPTYRDDNMYYIVVLDTVAICVIAIVPSIDRNITHHIYNLDTCWYHVLQPIGRNIV